MSDQDNEIDKQLKAKETLAAAAERARFSVPAVYADKFQVTYWKGHARITLGESSVSGDDFWRFAVLLEKKDFDRFIIRLLSVQKKLNASEDDSSDD